MTHVRVLSQAPRVVGSPEMVSTANYLVETLRTYGLDAEIQESPSAKGTLHNVIARIPGRDPSRALLILTHPDSVSFGAGDNASGVAVLLETARALQTGAQPRSDIILLFDDGEEEDYLGGYAFAQSHPWMKEIQCVIGLDTAAWGPVVLVQTTLGNGNLVRFYASSVPDPAAFGFFADAVTLSQTETEIKPFNERDLPGLELEDPTAFSGKHSADDSIEHVRPGSMQQMGEQTLALARSFGDRYRAQAFVGDLSYFTLWPIGVIHYPVYWNILLVSLAGIGLVILIGVGIKRKAIIGRTIALSFTSLLLVILLAGLAGLGSNALFSLLFPSPNPSVSKYLNLASLPFLLLDLIAVILIYLAIRKRLVGRWGASVVSLGGMLIWLLFAVVLLAALPVGNYILSIPLLVAVLAHFLPEKWKIAALIPAAIATILFAPNLVLTFLGTGMVMLALVNILVILNVELWAAGR